MDRITLVRRLVLLLVTLLLVGWPGADVQTTDGDWRATGFDAQRVAQLVGIARAAYDPSPVVAGYALVARHAVDFTLSVDVWDAPGDVVVAFSGTDGNCTRSLAKSSALVWKRPVEIRASSGRAAPEVRLCSHRYVVTGLRMLLNRYREAEGGELRDWLAARQRAGAQLTVTGHSRGGVAAMLMAHYELLGLDEAPAVLAVSAPAAFCTHSAARLEHRAGRTLTVAAADDPVVGLQHGSSSGAGEGCADDYRHVGVVAHFRDASLVTVEHRRSTSLASSLGLAPHAVAHVQREAERLAQTCS
jgi:hypothetical protein